MKSFIFDLLQEIMKVELFFTLTGGVVFRWGDLIPFRDENLGEYSEKQRAAMALANMKGYFLLKRTPKLAPDPLHPLLGTWVERLGNLIIAT